jgi:deazaflavin-dependent oxidoreductase (nitroreductase family)
MNLNKIESIPAVQKAGTQLLRAHQFIYVHTDGRIGHRLAGTRALILRTVGAKSGEPRTNALTYARDGDAYLVVASNGGARRSPGWYHNLRKSPDVEIQVGTKRIPAHARPVLPGDPDRDRYWKVVNDHNRNRYRAYQKATSRPIPIIALTPARRPPALQRPHLSRGRRGRTNGRTCARR